MRRKLIFNGVFIFILVTLICSTSVFFFKNSNYYYSKKLISAITEENIIAVKQIIEKKPGCINTYPSITPKWWHSAMNWRVYYPFNVACATGNIDLIELLIANGADVNCNDGLTPISIIYSSKMENWYNVSLILIENGASLDYTTEYSGGSSSVFQDIVDTRLDTEFPGETLDNQNEVIKSFDYALQHCDHSKVNWMRVLQHSVSNGRIEIVKLLLEQGYCDVNDMSVGMSALMFAARDSTPAMVQLLLDYGADKSLRCLDGMTAYDYAVRFNQTDVVKVLEE